MNKKLIIALTSITLMLAGCGNHSSKKSSGKASASPKASESTEPENTSAPEQTTQPPAETETPAQEQQPATQDQQSAAQSDVTTDTNQNTGADISGNYQIISYDNGSGNKETFDPGNDDSIIGSSSIVLNKDGSCEYNMPGVGENTSCTWSGNTLQAAGAETQFTVSGDEMTFQQNGETYTFQKAK